MTGQPTVIFLDRDGTIIRDVSYLSRAADVELLDGAAEAIARLNDHGIPVIVVTNQSGIARGRFTTAEYELTERRLSELLAARHARIDATYFCPDHPDYTGPCACRKPGTLLFERAASEHALDMSRPAFIGDRWRDIAPYRKLGGSPVLIDGPSTPREDAETAREAGAHVVSSLVEAVDSLVGAAEP